jgi:hypothetical protein
MLLTITTTHSPATDLGFLLHKNPARVQDFELTFGRAHVLYPEASGDRCTAALLLVVDPVGLVRNRRGPAGEGYALEQYVNDRPYVRAEDDGRRSGAGGGGDGAELEQDGRVVDAHLRRPGGEQGTTPRTLRSTGTSTAPPPNARVETTSFASSASRMRIPSGAGRAKTVQLYITLSARAAGRFSPPRGDVSAARGRGKPLMAGSFST